MEPNNENTQNDEKSINDNNETIDVEEKQDVNKPEGPKSSFIILLILFVLLIFGLAYYYGTKSKSTDSTSTSSPTPTATVTTAEPTATATPEETTGACKSTLTSSDKEMIKTWKTYKNTKYNFSFQYPENWKIEDQKDDRVVISDSDAKLNFYFASAEMSAFDLMQYIKDSEKSLKVACETAKEVFMTGDPSTGGGTTSEMKDIVTSFKKNDVPHVIMMDYLSQGASISSDIVEAYGIILKTVEFK